MRPLTNPEPNLIFKKPGSDYDLKKLYPSLAFKTPNLTFKNRTKIGSLKTPDPNL